MPKSKPRKACRECAKMESRLKSINAEWGDVRAVKNGLRDEIERLREVVATVRAERDKIGRERDEALNVNERQARLIVQHALERQRKPWWKRLGEIVQERRGR